MTCSVQLTAADKALDLPSLLLGRNVPGGSISQYGFGVDARSILRRAIVAEQQCGELQEQVTHQMKALNDRARELTEARDCLKQYEVRDQVAQKQLAALQDRDEAEEEEEAPLPERFIDILGHIGASCFPAAEGEKDPLARVKEAPSFGVSSWRASLLRVADKLHTLKDRGGDMNSALEKDLYGLAVMAVATLYLFRENTSASS